MTDDLVRQLRRDAAEFDSETYAEAADRIEELMKYQSLHAICDKVSLDIEQKLVNQLAAAHKRNKELEAALRYYAEYYPTDFRSVACAALAGEKKDD